MAGTRALLASIGASGALVAAAALSLLAISAVFAFGGWSNSVSRSVTRPALVFAGAAASDPRTVAVASRTPIVAPTPRSRLAPRRARTASNRARATAPAATSVAARGDAAVPTLDKPVTRPRPTPTPAPAPAPAAATTGDQVRKVGESLSSTVQNAGTALSQVTQPLAPPVSAAVQQVLNLVAEIVRRTTDGLGGTLDALLPKQ